MKIFIIITIIFSGVGSVIFNIMPVLGGILIGIGVMGGILTYILSEFNTSQKEYFHEATAKLLAESGIGNIYVESLMLEINKTGVAKNSINKLNKALEINPNDIDALSLISTIIVLNLYVSRWINSSENQVKLLSHVKSIVERGLALAPEKSIFHDVKGMIFDFEGMHNQAREEYNISSKIRTDPYWHLLLATSFNMTEENTKAIQEMEQAKKEGAAGWLFEFYFGRALVAIGEYKTAIEYLESSLKQNRMKFEILHFLSKGYYSIGNFGKYAYYELYAGLSIITQSTKTGIHYIFLAFVHYIIGFICGISHLIWKFSKKIPILNKIHLKLIPPYEPYLTVGNSLLKKNQFKAAEDLFRIICNNIPSLSIGHCNLAISLAKQGRKKEAIQELDLALLIDPDNDLFKWNKEQIENSDTLNVRMTDEINKR